MGDSDPPRNVSIWRNSFPCKIGESVRFAIVQKGRAGEIVAGDIQHQRRRSNRPGNSQASGPRCWTIWREALGAPTEGDIRTAGAG